LYPGSPAVFPVATPVPSSWTRLWDFTNTALLLTGAAYAIYHLYKVRLISCYLSDVQTGWPLFWKTWKSQGIEKWSGKVRENRKSQGKSEKSGKMNYYNYSVAAIIAQTIIGDYNNRTIDHGQLIF